jgi:hypothetical protein
MTIIIQCSGAVSFILLGRDDSSAPKSNKPDDDASITLVGNDNDDHHIT